MSITFIEDKKYEGKYVATPSFSDSTVIASGSTMVEAAKEAREKGYDHPAIIFVPRSDISYLL